MVDRLVIDIESNIYVEALSNSLGGLLCNIYKDGRLLTTYAPTHLCYEIDQPLLLFYNQTLIYSSQSPVLSSFRLI